jgi:pectate lyase
MNKKVFLALAVLVLVALACIFPTVNTPTVPPPTAIPPTALPPVSGGGGGSSQQILFQDDFSNTSSGWDRSSNEYGTTDYENGGYRINVIQADSYFFANPYKSFQNDVRIEVDATKIGGPDDNAFGVQCRYQDVDNYYYFYISSDGYVGIGIDNAGTKTIISSSDGNLVTDSNINQGAATNHIRVDCIGSTLTLFVNGTQVATATDSTFSGGDVGLVAKTFSVAGTDIMFNNFFVYKP